MNEKFMELAISLASKGSGKVNPNPLVGAVIVKDNKVIGTGYHKKFGMEHAEVNAFNNLTEDAKGAEMYVTLEPCSHYGKTPPCVDKIIEMGISKVYIGTLDPNILVCRGGVLKLRNAGVDVEIGILEDECIRQQEVFRKYITSRKPFVLYKSAMSLDGKIATKYGESKWISSEESRNEVQELRNYFKAIMVGVDTVITDNPRLTCRTIDGRNPIRIVVDSNLRIPRTSNILIDEFAYQTIIATTENSSKEYKDELRGYGIKIIETKSKNGRVDLNELMDKLYELDIDGILLEGGSTLAYSAISEGIVDKVRFYIAPKIIGGKEAKTGVAGLGIEKLSEAFNLKGTSIRMCSSDIVIEGYLERGK